MEGKQASEARIREAVRVFHSTQREAAGSVKHKRNLIQPQRARDVAIFSIVHSPGSYSSPTCASLPPRPRRPWGPSDSQGAHASPKEDILRGVK